MKENLTYSDYTVYECIPSKIDVGRTLKVLAGFECPRCKEIQKPLEHSKTSQCRNCHLKFLLLGNCLECLA